MPESWGDFRRFDQRIHVHFPNYVSSNQISVWAQTWCASTWCLKGHIRKFCVVYNDLYSYKLFYKWYHSQTTRYENSNIWWLINLVIDYQSRSYTMSMDVSHLVSSSTSHNSCYLFQNSYLPNISINVLSLNFFLLHNKKY